MRRAARQLPLPVGLPTLSRLRLRRNPLFRDRCGNGGDNRSFRGSLRERRERGKRRIIVGKQKSKTLVAVICLVSAFIVLAGGVCFIVFYVKKRRKNGEKKNLLRRALPKNDKTCYFGVFMRPVCYILNFFHRIGKENKEYTSDNFLSVADGIIAWKKPITARNPTDI